MSTRTHDRPISDILRTVGIMIIVGEEDAEERRQIRIKKIKVHMGLNVTANSVMYMCNKAGLPFPKGVSFDRFPIWLDENLQGLSDQELVQIMRKLGLTVVNSPDDFNGIFIIHCGADKKLADAITKALNAIDIDDSMIYYSSGEDTGTRLGTSFVDVIFKCIKDARLIVCLLSEGSINSQYCMQEAGAAMILEKPILPILYGIGPDDMPGFMDNTRYIATDMSTNENVKTFLKEVCRIMEINASPASIALGIQRVVNG